MKCAKCGKELAAVPRGLEGRVKMRCRACFGASPESSPIGEILDRSYDRFLAGRLRDRWSEAA